MDRYVLKAQLVIDGRVCPICGRDFRGVSPDMHEVLLTRGNARGTSIDIMVMDNTVLVHGGSCHIAAQTRDGREKCIKDLLQHRGQLVISWLESLRPQMKSQTIINERIAEVNHVREENY